MFVLIFGPVPRFSCKAVLDGHEACLVRHSLRQSRSEAHHMVTAAPVKVVGRPYWVDNYKPLEKCKPRRLTTRYLFRPFSSQTPRIFQGLPYPGLYCHYFLRKGKFEILLETKIKEYIRGSCSYFSFRTCTLYLVTNYANWNLYCYVPCNKLYQLERDWFQSATAFSKPAISFPVH